MPRPDRVFENRRACDVRRGQRRLSGCIVIGMPVGSPRCETEVTRPQETGECRSHPGSLIPHTPVRNPETDNVDPPTGKPFQGHLGFAYSCRTHVDAPRLCPGVRRLSVGDRTTTISAPS